jgi:hypothetical protein
MRACQGSWLLLYAFFAQLVGTVFCERYLQQQATQCADVKSAEQIVEAIRRARLPTTLSLCIAGSTGGCETQIICYACDTFIMSYVCHVYGINRRWSGLSVGIQAQRHILLSFLYVIIYTQFETCLDSRDIHRRLVLCKKEFFACLHNVCCVSAMCRTHKVPRCLSAEL